MFEAAVETSRKWDAFEAGKEVASKLLSKLEHKPKLVLLFATIHYEKNGGFKKLLEGVYSTLPGDVQLVGGTSGGFMNNHGIFTRGVCAFAVYEDKMDVAVGIGKNTKANPMGAGLEAGSKVARALASSKWKNKYALVLISGTKVPAFPILGQRKIINNPFRIIDWLFLRTIELSTAIFQIGMGRETSVLDGLVSALPDYYICGGSTSDDDKIMRNYQFVNREVIDNSAIVVALRVDWGCYGYSGYGIIPDSPKFSLTGKQGFGCFMTSINGKPARSEFMRIMQWPEEFLNEKTIFYKSYHYPVCYAEAGLIHARTFGLFFGENVGVASDLRSDELQVFSAAGSRMLEFDFKGIRALSRVNEKPIFGFGIICGIRLEALGSKCYSVHEKMKGYFDGTPFLFPYLAGETVYIPGKVKRHVNASSNVFTFTDANQESDMVLVE